MASSVPVKRSASTIEADAKERPTHHYHHHHRLQHPVALPSASEPALPDAAYFDQLINRSIGQILQNAGFDQADPLALESLRSATEECEQLQDAYLIG